MVSPANVEPTQKPDPTRRDVLGKACVISGCAAGAFAAVPAVDYLLPRPPRKPAGPVAVCRVSEVPEGGCKRVKYGAAEVLVVRHEGRLAAMDAKCTHLGCLVEWDDMKKMIRCPCHGATFDAAGRKLTDPAKTDLTPLRLKVVGDSIVLSS
jgi:cytochrome b6-f complex iron-sulfur subunit